MVAVGGEPERDGSFTYTPSSLSPSVDLAVRRVSGSVTTNVPLVVTDGCGDWPTFVGGGPAAF